MIIILWWCIYVYEKLWNLWFLINFYDFIYLVIWFSLICLFNLMRVAYVNDHLLLLLLQLVILFYDRMLLLLNQRHLYPCFIIVNIYSRLVNAFSRGNGLKDHLSRCHYRYRRNIQFFSLWVRGVDFMRELVTNVVIFFYQRDLVVSLLVYHIIIDVIMIWLMVSLYFFLIYSYYFF